MLRIIIIMSRFVFKRHLYEYYVYVIRIRDASYKLISSVRVGVLGTEERHKVLHRVSSPIRLDRYRLLANDLGAAV